MQWLKMLHKQWMNARKRRVTGSNRSFFRDWEDLLDDAGLCSAEDRISALRQAERIPEVKLHRLAGRPHIVTKIELPIESENWLHQKYGTESGEVNQARSLAVVKEWSDRSHPIFQEDWIAMCDRITTAFKIPRIIEPFRWLAPERVNEILSVLFELTCQNWRDGTLIRDASVQIGHSSKYLESVQLIIERALSQLFDRETTLDAIGIQTKNSELKFCGPLELHFSDHSKPLNLRFASAISVDELHLAKHITTSADRLLMVENSKTTFLQLARQDVTRSTLLVATSFPTEAVQLLLQKLSSEIPFYHFGDTDPSGWDILRRIRHISPRQVKPFHMQCRASTSSPTLSDRDRQIVNRLLNDAKMKDAVDCLLEISSSNSRGDFEQESLGAPDLQGWPFYSSIQLSEI